MKLIIIQEEHAKAHSSCVLEVNPTETPHEDPKITPDNNADAKKSRVGDGKVRARTGENKSKTKNNRRRQNG